MRRHGGVAYVDRDPSTIVLRTRPTVGLAEKKETTLLDDQ